MKRKKNQKNIFKNIGNKFISFDRLLQTPNLEKWENVGKKVEDLEDVISSEVDRIEVEYEQIKDNVFLG